VISGDYTGLTGLTTANDNIVDNGENDDDESKVK